MVGRAQSGQKRAQNYDVVRCTVLNVVQRESRDVDRKTYLTVAGSQRTWREIEVKDESGREFWVAGEVVYEARVGENIALVLDPRGREPLAMAHISDGTYVVHGSASPDAKEGKGVLATAFLIAVVAALPGLIIYFAILLTIAPEWTESASSQPLQYYPFFLIPPSIYAAVRLDRWGVARAKRVHGEIMDALRAAGVTGEGQTDRRPNQPPPVPV